MHRWEDRIIYIYYLSPTVNSPSQETEETQHPKRPVENVALRTKGLQERQHNIEWEDGGKIGNKNKSF